MNRQRRLISLFAIGFIALGVESTFAEVRLPGFFGDHMVIQQKKPIRIWGWADKGETVSVSFAGNTASATANGDGRWQVELPPLPASKEARSLTIKGNNSIKIKDVLVGEVWLCSGQSNMEWSVRASSNAAEEIAAADYPLIRHIKSAHRPSMVPMDDLKLQTPWQTCSPETVPNFTACGYFMARRLHKELDVPIGLINSSWGGTRVEPWTPPSGFQKVEKLQDIYASVMGRTPGTDAFKASLQKHISATEGWLAKAKAGLNSTTALPASPVYPASLAPFKSHQDPSMLYNGMIHAIVGLPIRGAIWYQGESNHVDGMMYFEKKKALINGWRDLWKQGDFPFYYVQIAPFRYGNEDPTILAKFWEAQTAVQQLSKTGQVVINDIATLNNIHPPNKQDVGLRLANLALKNDYGRTELVAKSPSVKTTSNSQSELTIVFGNTGGGLKTRDGKSPSHFELIAENSGGFQPATAKINGDKVVLSSDQVKQPKAFRFAWHKLAEPNLTGGTGLPVSACRGGKVPEFFQTIPGNDEYQLVYDINLSALGSNIKYDVDHSDSIGAFDRVGYLVELDSSRGDQRVFVSMDAFTDNVKKIGIPTLKSKADFQKKVTNMDVFSNVEGINTGTDIKTGNIEFWPNNYGAQNQQNITAASGTLYDWGDMKSDAPVDGYGSMQVHNHGKRQTVFAINHWKQGAGADIGIGNSTAEHRDWTFTASAGSYSTKRLRVYVRQK